MALIDPSLDPHALARALFLSMLGLLALTRVDTEDLRPAMDATFQMLRARTQEPRPSPSAAHRGRAKTRGAKR